MSQSYYTTKGCPLMSHALFIYSTFIFLIEIKYSTKNVIRLLKEYKQFQGNKSIKKIIKQNGQENLQEKTNKLFRRSSLIQLLNVSNI